MKPMQLRPGDEINVRILSTRFTIAKMRLFRNGAEVKRPDGGDGYSLPVNMEEGIFLTMKIIADSCGLDVEQIESGKRGGYTYRFEASKNNEGS